MSASKSPEARSNTAVLCRDVVKKFLVYEHRATTFPELFVRVLKGQPTHVRHEAVVLKNLNLHISHGERVGLIGRNGSGKTTALRLMAGIYRPTTGSIETFGQVASVMALGAGFSPELTGAENVELYGSIMGLSPAQRASSRGAILEFAEIGDFINTPVKYYSSGMTARLAFAVAVCARPDILLIDEVLAVGDEAFRRKCLERLEDHRDSGRTLVFVSHGANLMRQLCTRVIWLEHGEIRMDGAAEDVLDAYQSASARSMKPGAR